jgi:hypothetical protein
MNPSLREDKTRLKNPERIQDVKGNKVQRKTNPNNL